MIESRTPRRVAALIALGATIAVAWLAPTSTASAASAQPTTQHELTITASMPAPERAAAVAIDDITASSSTRNPLDGIPADFASVMGYRPTLGRLGNGEVIAINPRGGCSVIGGGRPFDLSVPCKAHDLGYDLLRYAHRRGHPLGTAARMRVDAKFDQDLSVQCASRYAGASATACDAMAAAFTSGVGFNSWRQEYAAPDSSAGVVRTVGIIAFAVLLLYFAGRPLGGVSIGRWLRRRLRRGRNGKWVPLVG